MALSVKCYWALTPLNEGFIYIILYLGSLEPDNRSYGTWKVFIPNIPYTWYSTYRYLYMYLYREQYGTWYMYYRYSITCRS